MGTGKAGPRIQPESLERHAVLCTLSCGQREHEGWKSEGSVQRDPGAVRTGMQKGDRRGWRPGRFLQGESRGSGLRER